MRGHRSYVHNLRICKTVKPEERPGFILTTVKLHTQRQ